MARSVDMWVGATDDAIPPPRVRIRVFDAHGGKCHRCGRKIRPGEYWVCEHMVALINGGRNAEDNLDLTCRNCVPLKNADDMAEKSKRARVQKKHLLPKERGRGFRRPEGAKFDWSAGRYVKP